MLFFGLTGPLQLLAVLRPDPAPLAQPVGAAVASGAFLVQHIAYLIEFLWHCTLHYVTHDDESLVS
jgi:hypothetical protein